MKSHVEYKNYQYKQIVMFYMGISDTDINIFIFDQCPVAAFTIGD